MNRSDIKEKFREYNPEITDRVADDTVLDSWLLTGNLEFATGARLISDVTTFSSVVGVDNYDLTVEIAEFFDIDQFPGAGVAYNNKSLKFTTRNDLDVKKRGWRTNPNGTPVYYYRRNASIYFEKPSSAIKDITVDSILKPDAFDDDGKTPFNQLTHLEPFHNGLVLYLTMRAKGKEGKGQEFSAAYTQYTDYMKWAKKTIQGGKLGKISIRAAGSYPTSMYR